MAGKVNVTSSTLANKTHNDLAALTLAFGSMERFFEIFSRVYAFNDQEVFWPNKTKAVQLC